MSVVQGVYLIVAGDDLDDFRTSRDIGDNQHRRSYTVWLRCHDNAAQGSVSGRAFDVQLRIDGTKRINGSKDYLEFEAVALLINGLVKVRGEINFFNGVHGQLVTVPMKHCDLCEVTNHTTRKRCDECGKILHEDLTYTL